MPRLQREERVRLWERVTMQISIGLPRKEGVRVDAIFLS